MYIFLSSSTAVLPKKTNYIFDLTCNCNVFIYEMLKSVLGAMIFYKSPFNIVSKKVNVPKTRKLGKEKYWSA